MGTFTSKLLTAVDYSSKEQRTWLYTWLNVNFIEEFAYQFL